MIDTLFFANLLAAFFSLFVAGAMLGAVYAAHRKPATCTALMIVREH